MKTKITLILLTTLLILIGAFSYQSNLSKNKTINTPVKGMASAQSKYEKIEKADVSKKHYEVHGNLHQTLETSVKFNDNEIIIANGETTDWKDCTIEMNATIAKRGYLFTQDLIPANESVSISLEEFVRDGVSFDPTIKKANNVMIMCDNGWNYSSKR